MNVPIEIIVIVLTTFLSIVGFVVVVILQNTKAINTLTIAFTELSTKDKMNERVDLLIEARMKEQEAKSIAHQMILGEHEYKIKEIQNQLL
jgi:hypothetical protein